MNYWDRELTVVLQIFCIAYSVIAIYRKYPLILAVGRCL